jgi:hypothetical protein
VGDGQIKIKTFWVFFVRLSVLCCATTHQTRFMFQFPAGRHRHRCRSVRATADATGRFVSSPWARPARILKGIFFGTSAVGQSTKNWVVVVVGLEYVRFYTRLDYKSDPSGQCSIVE